MEEIWRDVVILDGRDEIDAYKGKYQVSNLGRVKSLCRDKEKLLTPSLSNGGYLRVWLCRDNNRKEYKIHRLVGFAFLGDSFFEDAQIDHINTIRTDNRVENLRFCNRIENCNNELTKIHSRKSKVGRCHSEETKQKLSKANSGKNNPQARAVICITTGKVFDTGIDGAKYYGLKSSGNITKCCRNELKNAGKHPITKEPLKWAYLDEYEQVS